MTGDGMAVVAPRFMDFSGERVAIEPDGGPCMTVPICWLSVFHRHADCLGPVIHNNDVNDDVRECSVTGHFYLARFVDGG